VAPYDASVFSLPAFAQSLPHPQYIISPSIDPLSEKNRELEPGEVESVYERFELDPERPLLVQISRFDRFKDPVGVIRGYQLAKKFLPAVQLVLAGGGASDDPEGEAVLAEVKAAAADDPDIHILLLPPDAHRTINALQRAAPIVIQKSLREGFGLTVTEAMWKGRPVIGGDVGGIRLQVIDYHTGFLVNTPEGAALRIRYLLHQPEKIAEMGQKAQSLVRDNFLITRQLREYMTLMVGLLYGAEDRIELT
jgi:trehalose synthase